MRVNSKRFSGLKNIGIAVPVVVRKILYQYEGFGIKNLFGIFCLLFSGFRLLNQRFRLTNLFSEHKILKRFCLCSLIYQNLARPV